MEETSTEIATGPRKKTPFRFRSLEQQWEEVHALEILSPNESIKHASRILFEELGEATPEIGIVRFIGSRFDISNFKHEDGSSPLHVAVFNVKCLRMPQLIQFLLQLHPAALQCKNKVGLVPLHKAVSVCEREMFDIVKVLIDADLSTLAAKTNDGHTPFHLALSRPKNIVKELIEYMMNINGKLIVISDRFGHLPLHTAASRPKISPEIIELLLQANPNSAGIKDLRGFLPLHWILTKKDVNLEIVFLLVEHYPEGMLEHDHEGCTPYMRYLQNRYRQKEIEQALLELMDMARELVAEKIQQAKLLNSPSKSSVGLSSRSSQRRSSRKPVGKF